MGDRLRELWDFDDLDGTEGRLRARFERDDDDGGRAEVLTQLARVAGLRGRFDAGEALLREAELLSDAPIVRVRVALERGRLARSSEDPAAALPLFESAYATALDAGEEFLAGDAAHMAALVAPEGPREWTERGLELAQRAEAACYWAGPLLNNLGWAQMDAGDHGDALATFERALQVRERQADAAEIRVARYCVAKALRSLGRLEEAEPILDEIAAEARRDGAPDPYFESELEEVRAERGEPQG